MPHPDDVVEARRRPDPHDGQLRIRADDDLTGETELVANALGDDDPHPTVDVDDGRHPIRTPAATELPVVLSGDADHHGSVADDIEELRDAHAVAADEAAYIVPPDAARVPNRRRSPDR